MANIETNIYSKKEPYNINVRFYHNKIDCNAKSDIFLFNGDFKYRRNSKGRKSSKTVEVTNPKIKDRVESLSRIIIRKFTDDFPKRNQIDALWLKKIIDEFHQRGTDENDYQIYFIPLSKYFVNESKNGINPRTGKKLSSRTITRYNYTIDILEKFQQANQVNIKTIDVDLDFLKEFITYVKNSLGYNNSTVLKFITHIKQFLKFASSKGISVTKDYESGNFTIRSEDAVDTYLNEAEIQKIFSLDLSSNDRLDKVRDLFIVGLWTGLRISDLERINDFDISNNRIRIIETQKTGAFVEIPIHTQVKYVLEKWNYKLPTISSQKFNQYVKEVCKEGGIVEKTFGSIKNPETNRKQRGIYLKYQLISSHTCRRSFVSNHYGKIDDRTIMAITTHKSHSQFMDYVKITQSEHANKLEEYWDGKSQ